MSEERYKIEDNIPVPPLRTGGTSNAGLTDTLRRMEVGQSVLVKDSNSKTVGGFFAFLRRTSGSKFTLRKQGNDVRVWRLS